MSTADSTHANLDTIHALRSAADASCGNDAADRAQAYVALVAMMSYEVHAPALGQTIEKWALLMSGSHVPTPALIAALRTVSERCPIMSLGRACLTLNIDITDVLPDQLAA